MIRYSVALAGLLALALPGLALAEWSADGAVGLGYDSNIGNTPSGNKVKSAAAVDGGVAAAWRVDTSLYTAWQLRGSLEASGITPESDLSEARGSVRLRWMHRPGNGFHVPILAAWASAGARASGSDLRSGMDYRAGGFIREQLTTAVSGRLGYTFSKRESDSRVYDLVGRSVQLGLDWIATPTLTVYTELEHYNGLIVSSIVDNEGLIGARRKAYHYLVALAEETEPDDAYGDNWYAMKVQATANTLAFGANLPVWDGWSFDSRLGYTLTKVTGAPLDYGRAQLSATFLRRF